MKNKHKFLVLATYGFCALATFGLTGCGDKYMEDYPWMVGVDKGDQGEEEVDLGATDIKVLEGELKGAIPTMLYYLEKGHEYQYQRANTIDNYAGYWTVSQNNFIFGGALPTLYTFPNNYLSGPWNNEVFLKAKNAVHHAVELGKPQWRAVGLIIQAYVGHEVTDFYGSIPFTDWRNRKRVPPMTYENGADIYNQIFLDLDEAIKILNETQPNAEELSKIEDAPKNTLARGDWQRWVKFANSIKLRMAMNLVNCDPVTAQAKAEEAVNDPIGVFTENDQYDFAYYYEDTGSGHPLYQISKRWLDLRMGASIENILKRYDNRLIEQWFDKNTGNINTAGGIFSGVAANQDYIGIRQGVAMINKSNEQQGYGPFSAASALLEKMPKSYFTRVEALFLRAEGALRGWNMGGTAQELYEKAIRLTFTSNGIFDEDYITEYLNRETVKPVDYKDPYNQDNSIKGRVTCGVKWNDADSDELKLEKIITQKYIGVFPCSSEAWTTFRRTGYPRLFPVRLNNFDGVDSEVQLRRIPLVKDENNAIEFEGTFKDALIAGDPKSDGNPENASIHVFWDVLEHDRGEIIEDGSKYRVVIPKNF